MRIIEVIVTILRLAFDGDVLAEWQDERREWEYEDAIGTQEAR